MCFIFIVFILKLILKFNFKVTFLFQNFWQWIISLLSTLGNFLIRLHHFYQNISELKYIYKKHLVRLSFCTDLVTVLSGIAFSVGLHYKGSSVLSSFPVFWILWFIFIFVDVILYASCKSWVFHVSFLSGAKPSHRFLSHHTMINTVSRSPFFKDIILTVGSFSFAIWKEGVTVRSRHNHIGYGQTEKKNPCSTEIKSVQI